ncbi:hypothetical protein OG535_28765 [Kitasatospora sp. NBC_00085]|uniref:hypothetical protein n=1 Tax=unclassified Kitasatospora TaxID=2633591 RepID=UPI00324455E1
MSIRRSAARAAALATVCFLLGVLVGGATLYLLEHRTQSGQPVYLGIFTAVSFSTLAAVDRLVNRRTPPKNAAAEPRRPPAG